jgi:pimeloyl-ACP methyl ester carboxylesterase
VGEIAEFLMAADLRNLHAVLRLSPALLVGHSFGAVIAMHAAVSYPDMVRGLETVRGATHIAVLQSTDAFLQLVQQHCRFLRRSRGMVPLGNRSG